MRRLAERLPVLGLITRVRSRYRYINGSLLTKGLSFSLILASVPLLFLLLVAGSFVLTPDVVDLVENEFLGFLPQTVRGDLLAGIERYTSHPGSLSVITIVVFLLAVHNLFLDLHQAMAVAIRDDVPRGRSRLVALAGNGLFLVFVYAATLVSAAARWVVQLSDLNSGLISLGARALAVVLVALVFYALFRAGAGRPLRLTIAATVALLSSLLWQAVLAAGGAVVQAAGARFLAYGVLAWAVVFLVFMRVMAEILVHAAIVIRESA